MKGKYGILILTLSFFPIKSTLLRLNVFSWGGKRVLFSLNMKNLPGGKLSIRVEKLYFWGRNSFDHHGYEDFAR